MSLYLYSSCTAAVLCLYSSCTVSVLQLYCREVTRLEPALVAAEHCSSLPRQHCRLQFPAHPQLAADTPTVQRLCLRSQGAEESNEDSEESNEDSEDSEENSEDKDSEKSSEESEESSEESSEDSEESSEDNEKSCEESEDSNEESSEESEEINEENEEEAGLTHDMKNVSSHRAKETFEQFRPLPLQPRRLETSEISVNNINEEDHLDQYDLDAAGSDSDDDNLLQFSEEAFTASIHQDEQLYDFQPWTETTLLSNEILETSTITALNDEEVGLEDTEDDYSTLPSLSIFSEEEATTRSSLSSSSLLDVRREDKKLFSSLTPAAATEVETPDTTSSSSSSFSVSSEERRLVSLRPGSSGSK